jgi:Spy/CpxP family protein refolding chaperone
MSKLLAADERWSRAVMAACWGVLGLTLLSWIWLGQAGRQRPGAAMAAVNLAADPNAGQSGRTFGGPPSGFAPDRAVGQGGELPGVEGAEPAAGGAIATGPVDVITNGPANPGAPPTGNQPPFGPLPDGRPPAGGPSQPAMGRAGQPPAGGQPGGQGQPGAGGPGGPGGPGGRGGPGGPGGPGGRGGFNMDPAQMAARDEQTATALGLNDDQKAKFLAIRAETRKQQAALSQDERQTRGRELRQAERDKINAILTPEQQTKYDQMRPRGGRGGGPGGWPGGGPGGGGPGGG